MQSVIAKMAEAMAKEGAVTIEAKDAKALNDYFAANAKDVLNKGVKIEEVKGLKTDFQIRPEKGGYKLAFGEAEFVAYFKEFLRPQLVEMLF
jgi:V/A-type H+-transporting ATPase subunit E